MRLHAVALFIHVLGVIALFAGFAMQQRAGSRLRQAATFEDTRGWADLLAATRPMVPSGSVMLLLTGVYLAAQLGVGSQPPAWITVSAVAVVFIGVAAVAVVNRGITAITKAVSAGEGALSPDAARSLASATTWSALAATNGTALGVLWLMSARPGLVESLAVTVLAATIGAVIGARLGRGAGAPKTKVGIAPRRSTASGESRRWR